MDFFIFKNLIYFNKWRKHLLSGSSLLSTTVHFRIKNALKHSHSIDVNNENYQKSYWKWVYFQMRQNPVNSKWLYSDRNTWIFPLSTVPSGQHAQDCWMSHFRNHPDESILLDGWLHKHWIRTCLDSFSPTLPQRCNFSGFYRTLFYSHRP